MIISNNIFTFLIDNDTIQVIRFDQPPTYDEVMTSNNQLDYENESFQLQILSNINQQEAKFRSNTKLPSYEEALNM